MNKNIWTDTQLVAQVHCSYIRIVPDEFLLKLVFFRVHSKRSQSGRIRISEYSHAPDRHFPNFFSGHKNYFLSIAFILRLNFKLYIVSCALKQIREVSIKRKS